MKDAERQLLTDLRGGLLHLHKTLLEWERKTYERERVRRLPPGEMLRVVMTDPRFAWLHPLSELIVRIDETLEIEDPDVAIDVEPILLQARSLIVADENGSPSAQRYHAALQDLPDAILAHRAVSTVLKAAPTKPDRLH